MTGGIRTKIVVLGIGDNLGTSELNELNTVASTPTRNNVIRVQDFSSLMTVHDQLQDTNCIEGHLLQFVAGCLSLCKTGCRSIIEQIAYVLELLL